jgi:hypothetical protein
VKIFKTAVLVEDGGDLLQCDTIEYEGKLWLVPEWLEVPTQRMTMPTRIIGLDRSLFQKPSPKYPVDYFLSCPLPKAVFYGQIPTELKEQVVVIERLGIKILAVGGLH